MADSANDSGLLAGAASVHEGLAYAALPAGGALGYCDRKFLRCQADIEPRKPNPYFVCYPLQLDHPLAISILASTISLTPGTVSADISDDNKTLLIHALDAEDDQAVIDAIHKRYEKPLMEMFQ